MQDSPTDTDISSTEWNQVVESVGRTMSAELGENSKVKVNGGDFVYSLTSEFLVSMDMMGCILIYPVRPLENPLPLR